MNKYDWLELATRVLGVWFLAQGALGVLASMLMGAAMQPRAAEVAGASIAGATGAAFLLASGTAVVGLTMVLLAPVFVGWLRDRDAAPVPSAPRREPERA